MTVTHFEVPTANGAYRLARIAFVQSGWHSEIVDNAYQGFVKEIAGLGFSESAIDRVHTPGAFEIPLHAQRLARSGRYAAVVGSALVVDDGIYRFDALMQTVVQAMMNVQLDTGVPTILAVHTPHHFREHAEHRKYFLRHFAVKGTEAADACLQTVAGLRRLDGLLAS